ncbi:hypothetical protein ACIBIZ_35090 [Nonomuraea spiralis]|uniref:hypothetical protein n=1 Tax=Nonomuraea spiralis TaxID=46182 RepID=UPI0037A09BDD
MTRSTSSSVSEPLAVSVTACPQALRKVAADTRDTNSRHRPRPRPPPGTSAPAVLLGR